MRFQGLPSVKYNRSKFDLSHNLKTSFNVGDLVPLDIQEVLPGDTFSCKTTGVIRTASPFIRPIMDNMYMDIHHFYVPLIQVYDDAEKIFGDPSPSSYVQNNLKSAPTVDGVVAEKTVGDYFGLPLTKYTGGQINVLPFRAFAKIYDEWFRNQNVVAEMFIQKGDTNSEAFNNEAWAPNNYLGKLPKVSKRKDYFTSLVPQPQKGEPIKIGLGVDTVPVDYYDSIEGTHSVNMPLKLLAGNYHTNVGWTTGANLNNPPYFYPINPNTEDYSGDLYLATGMRSGELNTGLVANLSGAEGIDLNEFRLLLAKQRLQELDAMYGSRYNEIILSQFGVYGGDLRLHFTEYLGGGRIPITIQQVAQTSSPTENDPLAQVSGYSLSNGFSKYSKGFTEHGYVITVGCVKQKHSYSQGVNRMFTRLTRDEYYSPIYANLGYQPIYESEIFYQNNRDTNEVVDLKENVLGYNEAWSDYRFRPDNITGQMRSNATDTLDIWHLGDFFENAPTLSSNFIEENTSNIDRVLTVPSVSLDNFIADFWFDCKAIRVMPTYSTPSIVPYK